MKLYYNKISSIRLLKHLIFRSSAVSTIKRLIKLLMAKKVKCKTSVDFVGFTHKRKAENRVYGIVMNSVEFFFFKESEDKFNELLNKDIHKLINHLFSIGEKLIPTDYKHNVLSRTEFESIGYGLKDSFYHGDVSKGNVLKYKGDVILIDNEFEGVYSELYQNIDYFINYFYGNNRIGGNYYNFNWWYSVVQIYKPISKEELVSVFNHRLRNGCDIANKILSTKFNDRIFN